VPAEAIDEQIRACLNEKRYKSAFDLIVTHFSDKVIRLSYSILGNRASAEDVAQDVFVRVWRALPAYRGDASVATWLYAITRNTSFTARKRAGERQSLSLDEPFVRLEAERAAPQQSESFSDLPKLLSQLPEKHRQVMMLFYLEDKSYLFTGSFSGCIVALGNGGVAAEGR
jgi:RNA polymerase sigma-70 factor (ECF subfamily)